MVDSSVSMFSRSEFLIDSDPLEEIFALNLGDFLAEHLISKDLAQKIANHKKVDKIQSLKSQLQELVNIYSIDNTLIVLGLEDQENYLIYNSISTTIAKMIDASSCKIYLKQNYTNGLISDHEHLINVGISNANYDLCMNNTKKYKLYDDNLVMEAFRSKCEKSQLLDNIEIMAFPMSNNIEVVGVIVVEKNKNDLFSQSFVELIQSIGKLFATSMYLQRLTDEAKALISDEQENISLTELQHLRAELTAMIADLGQDQQNFVEKMALCVNSKSNYCTNHSQDVANLSKTICEKLDLNEKTTDLIYYAGLLQNIGKITLPKTLFSKCGKFTKDEWNVLQNHSNIGVNLLMNINFLSEVIPYIHYNKERWDGHGLPEGLKGQSIPLGSRIIAIADAFCALTSDRPHRKAMTNIDALHIIKSESGIKWDPVIVNVLFDIFS